MISRYNLFNRLLADELSDDKAQILAEPVKDLDHNRVNWYSSLAGQVVPFGQLADDDRRFALDVIAERTYDLQALSERFLASNSRNRKLAGELLANILGRTGLREIFMIGDRPVVAGWGLTPIKGAQGEESQTISYLLRERKGDAKKPAPPKLAPPASPKLAPSAPPKLAQAIWRSGWGIPLILCLTLFALLFCLVFWLGDPLRPIDPILAESPAATVVPPATNELFIPEGAAEKGDLSFMEGCWDSTTESLVNEDTDMLVEIKYCFDAYGRAKVSLEEKDAKGDAIQICESEAFASFDDGGVVIAESYGRRCPAGNAYSRSVMTCRPKSDADRSVDCVIEQESSDEKVQTDFHRAD
jgi:hypothetical protein